MKRVEALPCKAILEDIVFYFLCVLPLQLVGIRGKKSTPIVDWEVPMKSLWLVGEGKEGVQELKASPVRNIFWSWYFYIMNLFVALARSMLDWYGLCSVTGKTKFPWLHFSSMRISLEFIFDLQLFKEIIFTMFIL
jgi:hypothetical protein